MPVVLKPAVWAANFFFAAPRCGQSWSMLDPSATASPVSQFGAG